MSTQDTSPRNASENEFDPLLCFARSKHQTPDEVFDMLQERMRTIVGTSLASKGDEYEKWLVSKTNIGWPSVGSIKDWQHGDLIFDSNCFDAFASYLGVSIADVMGTPVIAEDDQLIIGKTIGSTSEAGLDPVSIFVVLAALDRIDEIAEDRRQLRMAVKQ